MKVTKGPYLFSRPLFPDSPIPLTFYCGHSLYPFFPRKCVFGSHQVFDPPKFLFLLADPPLVPLFFNWEHLSCSRSSLHKWIFCLLPVFPLLVNPLPINGFPLSLDRAGAYSEPPSLPLASTSFLFGFFFIYEIIFFPQNLWDRWTFASVPFPPFQEIPPSPLKTVLSPSTAFPFSGTPCGIFPMSSPDAYLPPFFRSLSPF